MKRHYAEGIRDRFKITEAAHRKVAKLVELGQWDPASYRSEEGKLRGYRKSAEGRQRKNECYEGPTTGFGELEYLKEKRIEFYSQYAVGTRSFDYFIPKHDLLVEVENPDTLTQQARMKQRDMKEKLAKDEGHKFVYLKSKDPASEMGRLLKNDEHEYRFLFQPITSVKIRKQTRKETLHCIGVEEDHSYVSMGVISHNCHPGQNKEKKYEKAVGHCRPNLINTLKELKPKTVLVLGKVAVKSILGWIWKEDVGAMERWAGWTIPVQGINAWVTPTWHPSFMLRGETSMEAPVQRLMFVKHLKRAVSKTKHPYETVPDHQKSVRIELDDAKAAEVLQTMMKGSFPVAFDYETNMKKPDSKLAEIVCCSVSDGKTTVAYPWHGKAIEATREFLLSDVPKVASNAKFEERWTRRKLGVRVKNWDWDTMLAAHVLDNRRGVTGIKFQAFALLGQGGWDDHVAPYLKSKKDGSNEVNRVRECDLRRLLTYCGMDSLMELLVSRKQKKMMRWEEG